MVPKCFSCLIASAPKTIPSAEVYCHISLTYFELLAASMGLGTVWCGLAKAILTLLTPEIQRALAIPETHRLGYVMMFGKAGCRVSPHHTTARPRHEKGSKIRLNIVFQE